MLEVRGVTKSFGGLTAVNNINLVVKQGEIVGLIGPNGAGKTTIFNLVTGFTSPTKGQILFEKTNITGKPPYTIAAKGIVRTFQQSAFLPDYTVLQSLVASCYLYPEGNIWEAIFNTRGYKKKEISICNRAVELLGFLGLESVRDELTQTLPHGYQRLLGIAMALSAKPKLLLLDEPLGGMNASEVSATIAIISKIRESGITILLVEHNMRAVMELCDKIVVVNFGQKIAEGRPVEIKKNTEVIKAYLGVGEDVT